MTPEFFAVFAGILAMHIKQGQSLAEALEDVAAGFAAHPEIDSAIQTAKERCEKQLSLVEVIDPFLQEFTSVEVRDAIRGVFRVGNPANEEFLIDRFRLASDLIQLHLYSSA